MWEDRGERGEERFGQSGPRCPSPYPRADRDDCSGCRALHLWCLHGAGLASVLATARNSLRCAPLLDARVRFQDMQGDGSSSYGWACLTAEGKTANSSHRCICCPRHLIDRLPPFTGQYPPRLLESNSATAPSNAAPNLPASNHNGANTSWAAPPTALVQPLLRSHTACLGHRRGFRAISVACPARSTIYLPALDAERRWPRADRTGGIQGPRPRPNTYEPPGSCGLWPVGVHSRNCPSHSPNWEWLGRRAQSHRLLASRLVVMGTIGAAGR